MHFNITALAFTLLPLFATAQNCGILGGNARCSSGDCCSEYSWCGTTSEHCSTTCQKAFSGSGAPLPCGSPTQPTYPSIVPIIDTCGGTSGNTCSGVGPEGYFYRCCSSAGHCGPKNPIQAASAYCGRGCQPGVGKCDPSTPKPSNLLSFPPVGATEAGPGEPCGPIVGRKCRGTLCCSGSNFCGTGPDYCGPANWCQPGWGECWAANGKKFK